MKKLYLYNLEWTVQTPLHVGAGMSRKGNAIDAPEVALILRDANGTPWLPGSTLKGALRALVVDSMQAQRLFGVSHVKGNPLARGTATIGGARFVGGPKAPVFELSQTSVDGGTGVAAASKLYVREFVVEGATFCSEIELEGCDTAELANDRRAFEGVLALAMSTAGLQIGANKADDLGRVVLTKTSCHSASFGKAGWSALKSEPVNIQPAQPATTELLSIDLICPGPFISRGKSVDNETHALVDAKGNPRIMGTAVAGALRKRAEWLREIHLHRGGSKNLKACVTSAGIKDLDPVERLFGYEGRRGLLHVSPSRATTSGPCVIPGVSIDAMSQAPRDGLLFFYHAHHGVRFTLSVSTRDALDPDEEALFKALDADISTNGLKLGLGTSKGFGWFHKKDDPTLAAMEAKLEVPLKRQSEEDPKKSYAEEDLPSPKVTIPYRITAADAEAIAQPEPRVAKAFSDHTLLSHPLGQAASGYIDLVWHVETPVLVASQSYSQKNVPQNTPFQKVGDRYTIPGSTLKGMLRAELERRVNARAYKIIENLLLLTDDPEAETPHLGVKALLDRYKAHLPKADGSYQPDFAEAMYGFVREPTGQDSGKEVHKALHLKSRISFGMGWLVSDFDKKKSRDVLYTIAAAEPRPISKFYDTIGRKAYLVDKSDAAEVEARLHSAKRPPDKYSTHLKMMHPMPEQNLLFSQRIHLHNLTEAEIGAFLAVLMLDFDLRGRFLLGRARAFNAGKCFPAMVNMVLEANDAGTSYPKSTQYNAEKLRVDARMVGQSAASFVKAFNAYMNQTSGSAVDDKTSRAMIFAGREFRAAHDPLFGQWLRQRSNLAAGKIYYQPTTDHHQNRVFPKEERDKAKQENNGRLAAMLKRKW